MQAGAGKYHFLRGGGGEGLELFTEAKAAFSAIFAGVKITHRPGGGPSVEKPAKLATALCPSSQTGSPQGEREMTEEVSVGCQACGDFFVGWSREIPLSTRWGWGRFGTIHRGKRDVPTAFAEVEIVLAAQAETSSMEQSAALPSTLCSYSQTGSPQREKRDNRKSSRGPPSLRELFWGPEQRNITFCAAGRESV